MPTPVAPISMAAPQETRRGHPPADTPADASVDASADAPADWPALWSQILAALQAMKAGAAAAVPGGPTPMLVCAADAGWQLRGACSTASAAYFGACKPLLDARLAHARQADAPPFVLAQLGQSLDGCVATAAGDSYFVTGAQSLLHLHRLRALCDAVLVGAGTVAVDNPQLTTRRVPGPQPVRVVLDPAARLDGRARVFGDGQAPTLWLCDARHAAAASARLTAAAPAGASAVEVLSVEGLLDTTDGARGHHPARAIAALAARGLRLLFVEGGGVTVSRFLAAGALDRLHLVVAPVLIGSGRRGLQGPPRVAMADCPRPPARTLALGEDMLWDLDLRAARMPPR
jgi:diaminohydroxyphosphoribosylaminopyrimidine deaminase / 5-amino-6-(5-phosphoribosylamino)uracil reductase